MRTLRIDFYGERIGRLFEAGDQYGIAFDEAYRSDPNAPILSLSLVNQAQRRPRAPRLSQGRVPAFFANLLPEPDSTLRSYLARTNDVDAKDDLALLRVLGGDLPGAVTLAQEEAWDERPRRARPPGEEANQRRMRFSLAGVQMKFSVRRDGDRYCVPEDGTGGTHIMKLPDPTNPDLPENEAAMMHFASACGIEVPHFELVPIERVDGLPKPFARVTGNVYVIERFDRSASGPIHIEDFAQVLAVYPEDKYHSRRTFDTLMFACNEIMGSDALAEFTRRLVFTVAIANADAHLKNWSLIYRDRRAPQLSPAYDYVCIGAYEGYDDALALPLGGTLQWQAIREKTFMLAARKARVLPRDVWKAASEMAERIVAAWPTVREDVPRDVAAVVERQLRYPLFKRA